jgi:glutathione S-transferase
MRKVMGLKITGSTLSPFVRKVVITCIEKGLDYELDPMIPVGVPDSYKEKHPLGKVPLLEDGDRVLPDSSAICAYLEKRDPETSLYPSEAFEYARAIWYEEFGDNGIVQAAVVPFAENVLARPIFQREPDTVKIEETLNQTLPPLLDYLEKSLGNAEFLVGNAFSIADITMGCHFGNFIYGGAAVDAGRWPGVAAYIDRLHGRPSFQEIMQGDVAAIAELTGGSAGH